MKLVIKWNYRHGRGDLQGQMGALATALGSVKPRAFFLICTPGGFCDQTGGWDKSD